MIESVKVFVNKIYILYSLFNWVILYNGYFSVFKSCVMNIIMNFRIFLFFFIKLVCGNKL